MARCTRTTNLEVHHKNRAGGNSLGNAQVLCHKCHSMTSSFGATGASPPDFSETTKYLTLSNAGN
ncbi:hypothetical protein K9N50_01265 [bacterium]|nr:hypothetical protein [bacterium]